MLVEGPCSDVDVDPWSPSFASVDGAFPYFAGASSTSESYVRDGAACEGPFLGGP